MMLQVTLEEGLTVFLGRDYYEGLEGGRDYRSGSKLRRIKGS